MSDNTPPPPSNTQQTPSHPSRLSLCPLSFPNLQATPSPRRPYIQYLPPRLIAKPNGKIPSMRTTKVSKSAALILAFRAFDAGAFSARPTDHHHRTAPSVQASSHAPPPPQTPPPQTPASTSSTDATRDDPHAVLGLDPTSSPPPGTSRKSNARIGISRGGATPTSPSGRTRRRGNGRRRTHTSRASTRRTRL